MDINNDISNVTSLPWRGNNALFSPLKELSQATKDRNMNQRQLRVPRNIELIEDYDDENEIDNEAITDNVTDEACSDTANNYSIITAVKEINGGLDLSNQYLVNCWTKHVEDISKLGASSVQNGTKAHNNQLKNNHDLNSKLSKRKQRTLKNAAIMGLVNTNKIAYEEVIWSDNETDDSTHNQHIISSNTMDNTLYQQLIPHHEDPEILIHPLHKGIDQKKFKDIDFTIARVGKHTKVTPREYFLRETKDDFFHFVKKKNDAI